LNKNTIFSLVVVRDIQIVFFISYAMKDKTKNQRLQQSEKKEKEIKK